MAYAAGTAQACSEGCCLVGTDDEYMPPDDPDYGYWCPMFRVIDDSIPIGYTSTTYAFEASDMDDPLATVR